MIRWYDTCFELMGDGYGDWEELDELQEQGIFGFEDLEGDLHMWAGDDTHPEDVIAYVEQGMEVDTLTAYKIVRERFIAPHKWMR
ncbi:hypothetical protein ST9NA_083 [Salmonella phage 9NA]|uniref:Uncharacterized protein n=1 Tax=Salmonella phage 9NA TaxID=1113547 RepID=A0A060DBH8_9CAUD|nr:hypothetical protein ST9NA_083 [Salmonella phage 9NA]AIB07086.1 hypothetical protein 9NA_083 [Salmonella phage 9NA]EDV3612606.1 hypothetical protein [Salmonella enterica subsp. enterica serovar 4,[5],12:i:-]EGC6279361.1 hypothetical protein [Salmonella enterica]